MFSLFRRSRFARNTFRRTSKSFKPCLEALEDRSLLSSTASLTTFSDLSSFLAATGATSATGSIPELGLLPGGADARQTLGTATFSISPPSFELYMGAAAFSEADWTVRLFGPD